MPSTAASVTWVGVRLVGQVVVGREGFGIRTCSRRTKTPSHILYRRLVGGVRKRCALVFFFKSKSSFKSPSFESKSSQVRHGCHLLYAIFHLIHCLTVSDEVKACTVSDFWYMITFNRLIVFQYEETHSESS